MQQVLNIYICVCVCVCVCRVNIIPTIHIIPQILTICFITYMRTLCIPPYNTYHKHHTMHTYYSTYHTLHIYHTYHIFHTYHNMDTYLLTYLPTYLAYHKLQGRFPYECILLREGHLEGTNPRVFLGFFCPVRSLKIHIEFFLKGGCLQIGRGNSSVQVEGTLALIKFCESTKDGTLHVRSPLLLFK